MRSVCLIAFRGGNFARRRLPGALLATADLNTLC